MLPARMEIPRALSSQFAAYEPSAVLINNRAATKGVRVWWICFPTRNLLEKFAADINGSILDDKELVIEKVVASWIVDHQNPQNRGIKSAISDGTDIQQDLKMEDSDRNSNRVLFSDWQGNLFDSADGTLSRTTVDL